jgi:hypothetical protein
MALTFPAFYPHRHNRDHSFDSICLKCLLTIANSRIEAELERQEKEQSVILAFCPNESSISLTQGRICRMKYIAEYAVSHLGNTRTGKVVLPGESEPKVGDIIDVRIEGYMIPVRIDSVVGLRKEIFGAQSASVVCSPCTI